MKLSASFYFNTLFLNRSSFFVATVTEIVSSGLLGFHRFSELLFLHYPINRNDAPPVRNSENE